MLNNNFGYACKNIHLSNPKDFGDKYSRSIKSNRSMIKETFLNKGLKYASKLSLDNCKDLFRIIKWNKINNFNFYRISTDDLFPWITEYNLKDLPDSKQINDILYKIGDFVSINNMRITSHPGPYNVLASNKKEVVTKSIKNLSVHGEIFDIMGLSRTTYNKINIHIGGAFGNKKNALKRFCDNFHMLPESVTSRLTVENDDKSSMFSVADLYKGIYRFIGIPIVFDYHHHKFCSGGLSENDALDIAVSTWGNIKPVVHYSESRNIEKNDNSIRPQAHSDYIYNFINTYNHNVDIMIEAKQKELAVQKYLSIHKSSFNNHKN